MKTPFDSALRIGQLELDELGAAMRETGARLDGIEQALRELDSAIQRELRLAARHDAPPAAAWFERARARHVALARDGEEVSHQLELLRDRTREQLGAVKALEAAADGWREEQARAADRIEQARIDDFTGARFAAGRGRRRRNLTPSEAAG